MNMCNR